MTITRLSGCVSNPSRPRILLITRNLPPLIGGMERLNWHMAEELSKVADVRVIGPEGSAAIAPQGVDGMEVQLKPLWRFLLHAATQASRLVRSFRPDIVLAGSGLTAPLAWRAARICGGRTAMYAHGLDVTVGHPVYRALWLPAIRRMDVVIANSRPTAQLCRDIGVATDRIAIVHPGVELPNAPHSAWERGRGEDPGDFRKQHGLGNRPVLLSVGRLSTRKGLREFVSQALPQIVAHHPDVLLFVIGDTPDQALNAQAQTPGSIQDAADSVGVGEHVRFLGRIADEVLAQVYRAADVHVFPIREIPGDPEGFGMVAVEAAAHGLPTVAFAAGGVVDAVAEGQSGLLIACGEYDAFAGAVNQLLSNRGSLAVPCLEFASLFAWPRFGMRVATALGVMQAQKK